MNEPRELLAVLTAHKKLYPLMNVQDAVKLAYQREFGCAHILERHEAAFAYLKKECAAVGADERPLAVDIGGGLCRLELRAMERHGITPDDVFGWMLATAAEHNGSMQSFQAALEFLLDAGLALGFDPAVTERFIADYRAIGCPPVHHSAAYAAAYAPAYRVVRADPVKSML